MSKSREDERLTPTCECHLERDTRKRDEERNETEVREEDGSVGNRDSPISSVLQVDGNVVGEGLSRRDTALSESRSSVEVTAPVEVDSLTVVTTKNQRRDKGREISEID